MRPIFHMLVLGVCVGGNANFSVRIGGNANFSVFRYQHVCISNAKFRVGGIAQREFPTRGVLRCMECRLYSTKIKSPYLSVCRLLLVQKTNLKKQWIFIKQDISFIINTVKVCSSDVKNCL